MRRIIIHLRTADEHGWQGAEAPGGVGGSRRWFCDLRFFAAAAAAAIAVHTLSKPEFAKKAVPAQVARGNHQVQIQSFAISPANARIATTDTEGCIAVRSPENAWQIQRTLSLAGFASEVAFAPDGRSLAMILGGVAPGVYLQDLDSRSSEPVEARLDSIQRPRHVAYSPDGECLAVTSDPNGTIVIWDLATRSERLVLHQPSPVVRMAFSPDGRWLATTGKFDRSIQLWDLHTGFRRILLEDAPGLIVALAFSPDGSSLASAGISEHQVRLWDLTTQEVCRVFIGHARSVNSVAFSPDGSMLATVGNDGMLGLWSVATGQRLLTLESQANCARTIAFSPDGRTLILATEDDDDIRSWYVPEILAADGAEDTECASIW